MEEKAEEVPKNRLVRAQEYGQRLGQRVVYAVDHLLSVVSTHARARVWSVWKESFPAFNVSYKPLKYS